MRSDATAFPLVVQLVLAFGVVPHGCRHLISKLVVSERKHLAEGVSIRKPVQGVNWDKRLRDQLVL